MELCVHVRKRHVCSCVVIYSTRDKCTHHPKHLRIHLLLHRFSPMRTGIRNPESVCPMLCGSALSFSMMHYASLRSGGDAAARMRLPACLACDPRPSIDGSPLPHPRSASTPRSVPPSPGTRSNEEAHFRSRRARPTASARVGATRAGRRLMVLGERRSRCARARCARITEGAALRGGGRIDAQTDDARITAHQFTSASQAEVKPVSQPAGQIDHADTRNR